MKFKPTWQQVCLIAVLLAAIIVAHVLAPPVVGAITSIVSTLVGAVFVDLRGTKGVLQDGNAENKEQK